MIRAPSRSRGGSHVMGEAVPSPAEAVPHVELV